MLFSCLALFLVYHVLHYYNIIIVYFTYNEKQPYSTKFIAHDIRSAGEPYRRIFGNNIMQ